VEFNCLKYHVDRRVCHIVLSRSEQGNSLDEQMVAELSRAFTQAQRNTDVKIILCSAEGEAFCIGNDSQYYQRVANLDFNQNLEESSGLMRLFTQITSLRKLIIAAVQGPALAAGCGLVTVCDLVIAARETATFGFPEARFGHIPAISLPFLVRRIGEGRARRIMLESNVFDAEHAEKMGLVTGIVPAMELEKHASELALRLINQNSSSSMGLIKELMSRIQGMAMSEALEYASNLHALARMTDDCKKGIDAAKKNEQVRW
jgi:methylglutaconyl-CoA hydratase